ncbi:MAG TPA: hypothetical protein VLY83_02690 [Methanoregula sp.]|nr:hypothetical protein [Methanoregula sp.]
MDTIDLNSKFVQILIFFGVIFFVVPVFSIFILHDSRILGNLMPALLIGLLAVIGFYIFWTRTMQSLSPLTPMELMDTRKRQVISDLSQDEAFRLCQGSLRTLPSVEFLASDTGEWGIRARIEMTTDIRFTISQKSRGQSEIMLEGWIADAETIGYSENLSRREQFTRQVIRVLDYLNDYLVRNASGTIEGSSPSAPKTTGSPIVKSIRLAAFLSLVSPGLGQYYNGRLHRGLAILALTSVGIIFYLIPGIIVWLYGIWDAGCTARKVNEGVYLYQKIPSLMLVSLFFVSLVTIQFSLIGFVLLAYGKSGYTMIEPFFPLG